MSNKKWVGGLLGIHALTPLHPGAGTALGTVDLPVQRERHTSWPLIAGSALKGILRDAAREHYKGTGTRAEANKSEQIKQLFGPESSENDAHAGALSVSDGRVIAYPVRSMKGVFAWISCPAVLFRIHRDAQLAGSDPLPEVPSHLEQFKAIVADKSPCLIQGKELLLEEFRFTKVTGDPTPWAQWIAANLLPQGDHYKATRERFTTSFVIVSDDDFTHFVKYSTEVNARIALDYESKTVKDGALFYQEFLPTESLFYSVLLVNESRSKLKAEAKELHKNLSEIVTKVQTLQIGGDETTGKGFCSVFLKGGN